MKTLLCALVLALPVSAFANTLDWDRNSEPDMASYSVYACFTPGCVLARNAGMHQGVTLQTTAGVKPAFEIDLAGKEGTIGVTAKDTSGNESGFSVPVPFDKVAPSTPANPMLR